MQDLVLLKNGKVSIYSDLYLFFLVYVSNINAQGKLFHKPQLLMQL